MEACPKVPMLAFELKLCNVESNDFSEKILKYILTHYHENPESYQKEINDLNQLRENTMCASKDFMGLNVLKKYYNQLQFISNRFPMKSGESCETEFSWDDLFNEKEIAHTDIRFEQECILYNIGAMHSYLGCIDKRLNDEGIKKSCTHFQLAAWAFQQVRDQYSGFGFTSDLNEDIMSFKMNLMLAQAQECVLEKSIIENRKPSINSKISTQIIDYYKLALTNNEKPEFYNNVGSRLSKDWRNYCTFKINYYLALTNYFGALASAEQGKYGESIGYIQMSETKLAESNKMKNLFKEFQEILKYTTDCIDTKSKILKKDNDFVYNQKIVAPNELPEIKGVSLVKCLPIDFLNDPEVVAQDIFIRLVSMKAHELSSMYSEEKAKLLRQISSQIEDKDTQLNQFMSALQINQLYLNNYDYLKFPKQLLECCAAISVKPNLLKEDIPKAMKSIVNVSVQAKDVLDEIEDIIENEEKEHRDEKIKSGKMNESDSDTNSSDTDNDDDGESVSMRSKKLKEISKRYDLLFKNYNDANTSNTALHDAFNSIIKNLNLLALPLNELSEKLPAIEPINDEESKQIRDKLVSLLAKVDEMKTQREQLFKRLQGALLDDDLTKLIASRQNEIENPSDFFCEQIKKHDQLVIYLQQNLQAQDNILRALAESNAQFATDRKKIVDATQQRNAFIDSLVLSYQSVNDLCDKASKGVVFFQNLLQQLNQLLDDVKKFCAKSKQERENKKKFLSFVPNQLPLPDQFLAQQQLNLPQQQFPTQPPTFNRYRPQKMPKIDQLSMNDDKIMPTLTSDRPKLKDFLPFMKPKTWGNTANKPNSGPPTVDRSFHGISSPAAVVNSQIQTAQLNQLQFDTIQTNLPTSVNNQQFSLPSNVNLNIPPISGNKTLPSTVNTPNLSSQFHSLPNASVNQHYNQINPPQHPLSSVNNQYPITKSNQDLVPEPIQQPIVNNLPPILTSQFSNQTQFNQPQMNYYQPNYIPNQTPQQPIINQSNMLIQQQQQKKDEELYKIRLEHQKIYEQKLLEQQQKEKEIEAKKKELEEKEHFFKLQQQQFFLQQQHQQQNFINYQQTQHVPVQPIQTNYIPNIAATLQSSTPYLQSQQMPSNPVQQQYQHQKVPVQLDQIKPSDSNEIIKNQSELLENIKPESVYKPGYFKHIKIDENNLNKNIIQPTSVITTPVVRAQSPAILPPNQFVQQNPSPVLSQSTYKQHQKSTKDFIPQVNNNNQAHISPVVTSQQAHLNTISNTTVNQSANNLLNSAQQPPVTQQFVNNNKSSIIDDLLDLFDGKNAQLSIPALQPLKIEPQLTNILNEQSSNTDQTLKYEPKPQEQQQIETNHVELNKSIEQPPIVSTSPSLITTQSTIKEEPKISTSISNGSLNSNISSSPLSTPNTNTTKKLNFLNNPTKLEKFVIEVNKFENHVKSLTQKTLSNATILEKEWKELNDYQEKNTNNYTISVARCYPNKNRFPDLLPYDQTRVVLRSKSGDDYINATLLGQLDTDISSPNFIISQAPSSLTDVFNFWSMILEQQIELVVCLCRDTELTNGNISTSYWPQDKQTPLNANSIKITLLSLKETPYSIQRICTVKNAFDNQSRTVIVLQHVIKTNSNLLNVSTGIGLNELPENISCFLKFIKEVEYYYKSQQRNLNHPLLVHCMNGVSRSAVFILLYTLLQVIDLNCESNQSNVLSLTDLISRYVKQMRSKRKYMIQSMCHLKYSYEAILYYLKDILIKEGVLNNFSFNEVTSNLSIDTSSLRKQSVDSNILNDDSLVSIQSSKSNEISNVNLVTTSPKQQQQSPKSEHQNGNKCSPNKSSPISLVDLCDPNKFSLSLNDDSIKKKHKFTKNDFLNPNSKLDQSNANDPFRLLDPLAK